MLDFNRFYHVGIVVPDLDAALETHRAAGMTFNEPIVADRTANGVEGPFLMNLRACYAVAPAPIEFVEEMPGTLWTARERGQLHHLAFVAEDIEQESRALSDLGWPKVAWSDVGWVYHESSFGYYVELIDRSLRAAHQARHA